MTELTARDSKLKLKLLYDSLKEALMKEPQFHVIIEDRLCSELQSSLLFPSEK